MGFSLSQILVFLLNILSYLTMFDRTFEFFQQCSEIAMFGVLVVSYLDTEVTLN